MRFLDTRDVPIADIEPPDGFDERVKAPDTQVSAREYTRLGGAPMNPITVDAVQVGGKWRVLAGRGRYAACVVAKFSTAPIRLAADVTDEDRADLEDGENLMRRDVRDREAKLLAYFARRVKKVEVDRAALLEELRAKHLAAGVPGPVTLKSGRIFDEALDRARMDLSEEINRRVNGVTPTPVKPTDVGICPVERPAHRPAGTVSPRGEVVREIAAVTGRPVAAVEREVQRAEAKVAPKPQPSPVITGRPEPAPGSVLPKHVEDYNGQLKSFARAIRAAMVAGKALAEHQSLPSSRAQRTRDELKRLAAAVDAETIVSKCPACKEPGVVPRCQACGGHGWLSEFGRAGLSPELRIRADEALPNEPKAEPVIPPGRFDGDPTDGLEPDPFEEVLPAEVLS